MKTTEILALILFSFFSYFVYAGIAGEADFIKYMAINNLTPGGGGGGGVDQVFGTFPIVITGTLQNPNVTMGNDPLLHGEVGIIPINNKLLVGTFSLTNGSNAVLGTGTFAQQQLTVADSIVFSDFPAQIYYIDTITDDLNFTLKSNWPNPDASGVQASQIKPPLIANGGNPYKNSGIDTHGNFFFNKTPRLVISGTTRFPAYGATIDNAPLELFGLSQQFGSGGGGMVQTSANGTHATPLASNSGDLISFYGFAGYDGNDYSPDPMGMAGVVDDTVSAGIVPSGLYFFTIDSTGTSNPSLLLPSNKSVVTGNNVIVDDGVGNQIVPLTSSAQSFFVNHQPQFNGFATAQYTGVNDNSSTQPYQLFSSFGSSAFNYNIFQAARGTFASPTASNPGDLIMSLAAYAYDGTNYATNPGGLFFRAGSVSPGAVGSQMQVLLADTLGNDFLALSLNDDYTADMDANLSTLGFNVGGIPSLDYGATTYTGEYSGVLDNSTNKVFGQFQQFNPVAVSGFNFLTALGTESSPAAVTGDTRLIQNSAFAYDGVDYKVAGYYGIRGDGASGGQLPTKFVLSVNDSLSNPFNALIIDSTGAVIPKSGSLLDDGIGNAIYNGTGSITLPTGTTAQRPVTPTAGMFRGNSETGIPEFWDNITNAWGVVSGGGGGTVDSVSGNDPIFVDNTDLSNPIVNLVHSPQLVGGVQIRSPDTVPLTGTVSIANGTIVLNGTGTLFTQELMKGDAVRLAGFIGVPYYVDSIFDDVSLNLTTSWPNPDQVGIDAFHGKEFLIVNSDNPNKTSGITASGNFFVNNQISIDFGGKTSFPAYGSISDNNSSQMYGLSQVFGDGAGGIIQTYAQGSAATPLAPNPGDLVGAYAFSGYDGSAYSQEYTGVFGVVDNAVSTGIVPTALYLATTDTTGSTYVSMILGSDRSISTAGGVVVDDGLGNSSVPNNSSASSFSVGGTPILPWSSIDWTAKYSVVLDNPTDSVFSINKVFNPPPEGSLSGEMTMTALGTELSPLPIGTDTILPSKDRQFVWDGSQWRSAGQTRWTMDGAINSSKYDIYVKRTGFDVHAISLRADGSMTSSSGNVQDDGIGNTKTIKQANFLANGSSVLPVGTNALALINIGGEFYKADTSGGLTPWGTSGGGIVDTISVNSPLNIDNSNANFPVISVDNNPTFIGNVSSESFNAVGTSDLIYDGTINAAPAILDIIRNSGTGFISSGFVSGQSIKIEGDIYQIDQVLDEDTIKLTFTYGGAGGTGLLMNYDSPAFSFTSNNGDNLFSVDGGGSLNANGKVTITGELKGALLPYEVTTGTSNTVDNTMGNTAIIFNPVDGSSAGVTFDDISTFPAGFHVKITNLNSFSNQANLSFFGSDPYIGNSILASGSTATVEMLVINGTNTWVIENESDALVFKSVTFSGPWNSSINANVSIYKTGNTITMTLPQLLGNRSIGAYVTSITVPNGTIPDAWLPQLGLVFNTVAVKITDTGVWSTGQLYIPNTGGGFSISSQSIGDPYAGQPSNWTSSAGGSIGSYSTSVSWNIH